MDWLVSAVRERDSRIHSVTVDLVKGPVRSVKNDLLNPGAVARGLPDLISAAVRIPLSLTRRKLIGAGSKDAIDNESERIVQDVLKNSRFAWSIASVEGEGDGMNTLKPGQTFGHRDGIRLVYDPFDGTKDGASGAKGPVVLLAIGPALPTVRDVRSPASAGVILLHNRPIRMPHLDGTPEAVVTRALEIISEQTGRPVSTLTLARWAASDDDDFITMLRALGAMVRVFPSAAETVPILANDVNGLGAPYDLVITQKGIVEAQIGAILTEQRNGQAWIRSGEAPVLAVESWTGGRGLENYVVVSAATPNPWIRCNGPTFNSDTGSGVVQLLLSDPSGRVLKLTASARAEQQ